MPRLFVAIDLPEELISSFATLVDESLTARWTPSDQYHLTLRFIGDVDGARVEDIRDALSGIDAPPFELSGDGLDVFPSRRRPRVLVARIANEPRLMALQTRVDRTLLAHGIAKDRKPFNPHITFARPKASPREVRAYMKEHVDFGIPEFSVDRFHLYRSDLETSGAVHTVLQTYELTERG